MPQVLWESNREILSPAAGAGSGRRSTVESRGVHPFLRIVRQMSAGYSTKADFEPPERSF